MWPRAAGQVIHTHRLAIVHDHGDGDARTPDIAGNIYVLGGHETAVTIYSQQVRALNLIAALAQTTKPDRHDIAIIGAGISGITAAVAAVRLGMSVTVYESVDILSSYPPDGKREVFPRLFEWPRAGWDRSEAGLPFFNWSSGPISRCRTSWHREWTSFYKECDRDRLNVVKGQVESLRQQNDRVAVVLDDKSSRPYSSVVIATGYGYERTIDGTLLDSPSYWLGPRTSPKNDLVVIGSGDGGIQELLHRLILRFSWPNVIRQMTKPSNRAAMSDLESWIDRTAVIFDPGEFSLAHQSDHTLESLVRSVFGTLKVSPTAATCRLVASECLFVKSASPLNRVLLRYLILPDQLRYVEHFSAKRFDRATGQLFDTNDASLGEARIECAVSRIGSEHAESRRSAKGDGVDGKSWTSKIHVLDSIKDADAHLREYLHNMDVLTDVNRERHWRNDETDTYGELSGLTCLSGRSRQTLFDAVLNASYRRSEWLPDVLSNSNTD